MPQPAFRAGRRGGRPRHRLHRRRDARERATRAGRRAEAARLQACHHRAGQDDRVRRGRPRARAAARVGQPDRRAPGQARARPDRARHEPRRGGGASARAFLCVARTHRAHHPRGRDRNGAGQGDRAGRHFALCRHPVLPVAVLLLLVRVVHDRAVRPPDRAVSGYPVPRDRGDRRARARGGQAGAERVHRRRHADNALRAAADASAENIGTKL